jgi:hypothetical protein
MKGLNSTREFATINYYFAMHILFTTIYLLQEHQWNHRNYSKQELSLEIFVWATNTDMTFMQKFILFASTDICKQLL